MAVGLFFLAHRDRSLRDWVGPMGGGFSSKLRISTLIERKLALALQISIVKCTGWTARRNKTYFIRIHENKFPLKRISSVLELIMESGIHLCLGDDIQSRAASSFDSHQDY